MGVAEYGFAIFVFILACAFALLCKYLFGRTKTHLQALDEKEKKLLALYSTLEDMMDEFNDSAVQASGELAHHIAAMRNVAASLRGGNAAAPSGSQARPTMPAPAAVSSNAQAAPQTMSAPVTAQAASRIMPATAANPYSTATPRQNIAVAVAEAPMFEVISEAPPISAAIPVDAEPQTEQQPSVTEPDKPTRILALHKDGMDRLHIAKELSVTLSEVDLVLGIAGQR